MSVTVVSGDKKGKVAWVCCIRQFHKKSVKKHLEFLFSQNEKRSKSIFFYTHKNPSAGALCVWTWNDAKGDRQMPHHKQIWHVVTPFLISYFVWIPVTDAAIASHGQCTSSTNKGGVMEEEDA